MMNNEQALEGIMDNKVECYAMVGGLYVSNVSITELCVLDIEWLG
ncbi:hypothetical protein BSP10_134 [Bacillus phage BSP10]|nr:hypothetical protein IM043_gp155 [Bacillus phage SPG24]AUO79537.1 hypothetical protein BSP10_134 [Bacillus phage BSP10]QRI44625.1 hypothetical protein BSTP3_079 [Bacillus phage BSTP3]